MNKFNLVLPNGKVVPFEYNVTSDLFMVLNQNQIVTVQQFQSVKIEVPNNLPKSRKKEVMDAVKAFKIPLAFIDNLEWTKGGIGTKIDWNDPKAVDAWMIARGVNISNPSHKEAVLKTIEAFDKAEAMWKQLRDAKIVATEARAYYKTIQDDKE